MMQTSPRARGRENPGAAGSQALRSAARDPRIKFLGGLGAPGRGPRIARALGATVLALLAACTAPGSGRMRDDGAAAASATGERAAPARGAAAAAPATAAAEHRAAAERGTARRRIGVVYVFHGGSAESGPRSSWEATLQIFVYDPNSPVYRRVIWNREQWPAILAAGNAPKELQKYAFSYARIGGRDPSGEHTLEVFRQFRELLEARERELGVDFIVDYASWIAPDPRQHAYPRLIHEPRVPGGAPMSFCDAAWRDCDPARYDVDGTIERLLAAGVDEIQMIDLTTSGVRFFKSWDVVNLARQVVDRHNARHGTAIAVRWVNDPTDLMTSSYPAEPAGWTLSLGEPARDVSVPLAGRPNPVSDDPQLAALQVAGIERRFSSRVPPAQTGVLLVNHATREGNRWFDPKIDDTLVFNANIRRQLLARHPRLDLRNVVEGWFGRREANPTLPKRPPSFSQLERTRAMRGENLGEAFLYETHELPRGDSGLLYWDALERLKRQGVRHIVVAFPQIMVDSVLNLVEVPNQIAKEIGWRSWARIDALDHATWPETGHPFADYWGIWVETECPARSGSGREPCCFTMGGCDDGRPYPPPRLTPPDRPRDDLDPSLAFDVSDYGHLGYDAARGRPSERGPVQQQYRGTWDLWQPPNGDPGVARFLADKVVASVRESHGRPPPAKAVALHGLDRRAP